MTDSVLTARALLDRTTMRPGAREDLHLVVDLTASGAPAERARPKLRVLFCVDASTSMTGEPLAHVQASVEMIVDLLDDTDEVGLVAFSSHATIVAAPTPLAASSRAMLKRRVNGLHANGHTNIESGLLMSLSALGEKKGEPADVRQILVLLSDGEPNRGRTSVADLGGLVEAARAEIGVVTLGYGSGHNADVLNGIAKAAGGQYWFIPEPSEARSEFARALGAQGDVVCGAVEVALMPAEGVEIVRVLNVEKTRYSKDGLVVMVPDLRDRQNHKVVAKLSVSAPPDNGPFAPVDVLVRHKPVGVKEFVVEQSKPIFGVADREPQDVVEALHAVLLAEAEEARAKARSEADLGRFDGAARILRAVLDRLQKAPGYVVNDGSPLSEAVEQLVDEVTAYERKPSATEYMEFRATALGVDVAQGAKHAADVVGNSAIAMKLQRATTTQKPIGELVIVDKRGQEHARVPLAGELVIGRVAGNDITLSAGNISKRHARVVVRDGKAIVVDLKTTNGTYVNGVRVSSPRVLSPSDKVYIGDFSLRFDALPDAAVGAPSGAPTMMPVVVQPKDAQPIAPSSDAHSVARASYAPVIGTLEILNAKGEVERSVPLAGEVRIGRTLPAEIVVPRGNVSKRHARVIVQGTEAAIVDESSYSGTYVNGERIKTARILSTGDVIVIGDVPVRVDLTPPSLREPRSIRDMPPPNDPPPPNAYAGLLTPMAHPSLPHLAACARAGGAMSALVIVDERGLATRVPLTAGMHQLTIGREAGNTVKLNADQVASTHARIVLRQSQAILVHLGAPTGTVLNGDPVVAPRVLRPGDLIGIGPFLLVPEGDQRAF